MIFRYITLRKDNDEFLKFYPQNIQKIIFEEDSIVLHYWQEPNPITTTKIILKKDDYFYPHWDYFINQLTRIFEIERFKFGD